MYSAADGKLPNPVGIQTHTSAHITHAKNKSSEFLMRIRTILHTFIHSFYRSLTPTSHSFNEMKISFHICRYGRRYVRDESNTKNISINYLLIGRLSIRFQHKIINKVSIFSMHVARSAIRKQLTEHTHTHTYIYVYLILMILLLFEQSVHEPHDRLTYGIYEDANMM